MESNQWWRNAFLRAVVASCVFVAGVSGFFAIGQYGVSTRYPRATAAWQSKVNSLKEERAKRLQLVEGKLTLWQKISGKKQTDSKGPKKGLDRLADDINIAVFHDSNATVETRFVATRRLLVDESSDYGIGAKEPLFDYVFSRGNHSGLVWKFGAGINADLKRYDKDGADKLISQLELAVKQAKDNLSPLKLPAAPKESAFVPYSFARRCLASPIWWLLLIVMHQFLAFRIVASLEDKEGSPRSKSESQRAHFPFVLFELLTFLIAPIVGAIRLSKKGSEFKEWWSEKRNPYRSQLSEARHELERAKEYLNRHPEEKERVLALTVELDQLIADLMKRGKYQPAKGQKLNELVVDDLEARVATLKASSDPTRATLPREATSARRQ